MFYNGDEKRFENVVISHISTDGELVYATKNVSDSEYELLILDNGKFKSIEEKALNIVGINSIGTELMYTTADGTFVYVD